MASIGAAGLKCVLGSSPERPLGAVIEDALRARLSAVDVSPFGDDAVLVCTDASAADVRDWLGERLRQGESVLVLEFETWSGRGPAIDREWLTGRGH